MTKIFTVDQLVRFSHCDPAGIVYYPEFFDLQHAVMEDWFRDGVGRSLPEMIRDRRIGTPTVNIQCDFAKPLTIGDTLHWELRVLKAGRASRAARVPGTEGRRGPPQDRPDHRLHGPRPAGRGRYPGGAAASHRGVSGYILTCAIDESSTTKDTGNAKSDSALRPNGACNRCCGLRFADPPYADCSHRAPVFL